MGPLELFYAIQMSLRAKGELDVANVIKEVTLSTPKRAKKYKKAYIESLKLVTPYFNDKAFSITLKAKLSKRQYNIIRSTAEHNNCNIYSPYKKITLAKKSCYPETIIIIEIYTEVRL